MPRKPGQGGGTSLPTGSSRKEKITAAAKRSDALLGRQPAGDPSSQAAGEIQDDVQMADVGDDDPEYGGDDESDVEMIGDDGQDSEDESEDDADGGAKVNMDDVRSGDIQQATDSTVRAGLDPNEALGAAEYEAAAFDPTPASEPFADPSPGPAPDQVQQYVELGEDEAQDIIVVAPQGSIEAVGTQDENQDISRLVPMNQNKFLDMSTFEMGMAAFVELSGLSRVDWDRLRELLFMLIGDGGDNVAGEITNLPKQLSTLRDRFRKRLPLMNMREMDVPLDIEKLPTLPPGLKPEERAKLEEYKAKVAEAKRQGRSRRSVKVEAGMPVPVMKLTFFDPVAVFKNIIASDIFKQCHSGPAVFVDQPVELYHSHAWASSVRSTSGIYAHVWVNNEPKAAIFPSDFIYYHCLNDDCYCQAIEDDSDDTWQLHIGRVYGVGEDRRPDSQTSNFPGPGKLTLQIQEALRPSQISNIAFSIPLAEDELVLTSEITYIPEIKAFGFIGVYVDRTFGEEHENPIKQAILRRQPRQRAAGKEEIAYPKYYSTTITQPRLDTQYYQVRRMIVNQDVIPMCHTHPIRAELEIECYGRSMYADKWDKNKLGDNDPAVVSLPILTFIDGFGVFQNAYRTLMGMYFTPAGLPVEERFRAGSMFPILLGPHGSDLEDIVKGLKTMANLDRGVVLGNGDEDAPGKEQRVCVWSMCYLGDMPQQAENSGFKGPVSNKFCRCCFAQSGQKATDPEVLLRFDIVTHGRFHVQTRQMQDMMKGLQDRSGKVQAEVFGKQWGINNPDPPLMSISPALDLILSRPLDAAHSEFNGLGHLMHLLLTTGIMTTEAKLEYAAELRVWKFPPGWQRLQSPLRHLGNYTLSEHATWCTVAPVLFRAWLKPEHLLGRFASNCQSILGPQEAPVDMIVKTCALIAKSNSLLMGYRISSEDRENMPAVITQARKQFNQLSMAASASVSKAPSVAGSRAGSPSAHRMGGDTIVHGIGGAQREDTVKGEQFLNDTLRPNIHAAVHYPMFAEEYALPVNCNTLVGENEHRIFKTLVRLGNFLNIEKILLMKMNFQETCRFVLRNAFKDDDPELTEQMLELYRKCPSMFEKVLTRVEQDLVQRQELLIEEFEVEINQSADADHVLPSAINAIPKAELDQKKHKHAVNDGKEIPRFPTHESAESCFRNLIRLAYEKDYAKPTQYPPTFQRTKLQWSRKFGFTDRASQKRFTFSIGDYIQYSRDGGDHFACVDHIFLLDNLHDRHVFVVVTPVRPTGTRDHLLDLEVLEKDTSNALIIGVTAVKAVRHYMVDVDGVGIVWVEWDVYFI